MGDERTHRTTTTDGVTIVGAVAGEGPSVVFTPGGIGDGELDWRVLLPHLTDHFTCHLPSLRGRGHSDEHTDLRSGRLVDDLVAYIDSIGDATRLVGWSAGGMVLSVAARSDIVDAVAAVEPTMFHLLDDDGRTDLGAAVVRTGELARDGGLTEAIREFLSFPFTDEDMVVAEGVGYFEAAGRHVPTLLDQLAQTLQSKDPGASDPEVLGSISADVLVISGSETKPFLAAGARYVIDHVPHAALREVTGAGHAVPLSHPDALADVLTGFFSPTDQRR